jgi:hypothetical protein
MSEIKKDGWVRCIAEAIKQRDASYNQFKVGEYYQVDKVYDHCVCTKEGFKLIHTVATSEKIPYSLECEWVGMEKPPVEATYFIF